MKNLKFTITALAIFLSLSSIAQVNTTVKHSDGRQLTERRESSQPATGSMYINERYMPAQVTGYDNNVLVRYNAYSDYFEINNTKTGQAETLSKNPEVEITVVSTNQTYKVLEYKTEKGETHYGYLTVISEGPKVSLYKKETIVLQPEFFPSNSYQSYKAANYKKSDDEYYIKLNNEIVYLSSKSKHLAKMMPEQDKEIKTFIKKNKISLDKEQDLVKLADYLQTIL